MQIAVTAAPMPPKSTSPGSRRTQVFDAVRVAAPSIGVADLAQQFTLHPNTVRFHLDALEAAGQIERVIVASTGRGRPRVHYQVIATAPTPERRFELLAGILTAELAATTDGRKIATRAGYSWGKLQAERTVTQETATGREFLGLLDELGFAPGLADEDFDAGELLAADLVSENSVIETENPIVSNYDHIDLLNCPFQEVVDTHGDVVCSVHLGMMRGVLAGWSANTQVTSLQTFVQPGVCRVNLTSNEPHPPAS